MKVEEIMTREVLTIGPEADVRDVARVFVENGISGLPVCGAQREVLDVVSEGDILFKEHGPVASGSVFVSRLRGAADKEAKKARARTVHDAMTAPAITVSPQCSVARAARLMSEYGINRLPVVRGDELVGIVTRTDLVRAFVRSARRSTSRSSRTCFAARSGSRSRGRSVPKSSAERFASQANSRREAMRCSSSGSWAASLVWSRSSPLDVGDGRHDAPGEAGAAIDVEVRRTRVGGAPAAGVDA